MTGGSDGCQAAAQGIVPLRNASAMTVATAAQTPAVRRRFHAHAVRAGRAVRALRQALTSPLAVSPAMSSAVCLTVALTVSLSMTPPAFAEPVAPAAASGAPPAASERTAIDLLNGINASARRLAYDGTFVFQRDATVQASNVVHFVDNKQDQYQKVDGLDGTPRSVVQHNDDLFTFLPTSHTVILDQRKSQDNFPALLSAGSAQVLQVYDARLTGSDRVAGIDCSVVTLAPRDAYRYSYRLSIDPVSGLLVRAQTLDDSGHVLEQVAFSQLRIGSVSPDVQKSIRASIRQLGGWRTVRAPAEPVDIESAGWSLGSAVPGFRKVLEIRRPMAARDPGAPPVPVDQAVFSDGVTAISLFIEPVGKSDRKPGEGRAGATHLLAEQRGAFWVTLIGEVPEATLRRFASALRAPN